MYIICTNWGKNEIQNSHTDKKQSNTHEIMYMYY